MQRPPKRFPTPKKPSHRQIIPQNSVLKLRIHLTNSSPRVWRRILVRSNDTFRDLHTYIQKAMGWKTLHGHEFITKSKLHLVDNIVECSNSGLDFGDVLEEKDVKLSDFLWNFKDSVTYLYDFCDGWYHNVYVEDILPMSSKETYPVCVDGKKACPPEGCGGTYGYQHLLEVRRNRKHEKYEELIENWLDKKHPGFDPDKFEPNFLL